MSNKPTTEQARIYAEDIVLYDNTLNVITVLAELSLTRDLIEEAMEQDVLDPLSSEYIVLDEILAALDKYRLNQLTIG